MHVKNREILICPCVAVMRSEELMKGQVRSHVYYEEKCLSDVGELAVRSYEREDLSGF